MFKVGDELVFKGRYITITKLEGGKVWYQGTGIGGSSSERYFKSQLTIAPPITTQADVVPSKTTKITSTKTHIPLPIPITTVPDKDTSLLSLTKTGSTKLYVIVGGIALIIIYFNVKIFRNLIK